MSHAQYAPTHSRTPPMPTHAPDGTTVTRGTGPGETGLDRLLASSFTADAAAPGRARLALRALAGHFESELCEDMRLLVSELVTNSLRHTGTSAIRLEVWGSDEVVHVEVIDDGEGFEVPAAPVPGRASGWGLFMVDRLTDHWGVDTAAQTRVWFELDRIDATERGRREFFDGTA